MGFLPLTAHTHHSPLTTPHSPLTTHHSPLTTHHSPNPGSDLPVPSPAARARRSSVAALSWWRPPALRRPHTASVPGCVAIRKLPARPPATRQSPPTCGGHSVSGRSCYWVQPAPFRHRTRPGSAAGLGGGPGH